MSLTDAIAALRSELAERQDWRARYARLKLDRLDLQQQLAPLRVQQALQDLRKLLADGPSEQPRPSPLQVLFRSLKNELNSMEVGDYKRLRRSVQGKRDGREAWQALLPRLAPKPVECEIPPAKLGLGDTEFEELSLKALLLLAQRDDRQARESLRRAREERSSEQLGALLKSLEEHAV